MPQRLQPFLHDVITTFAAPTQVLAARTGDVRGLIGGPTAQGVLHADVRVLSDVVVRVDGRSPEHISTRTGADVATFTSVVRQFGAEAHGEAADRVARLDRERRVSPGVITESVILTSAMTAPIACTLEIALRSDFAPIEQIRVGDGGPLVAFPQPDGDFLTWSNSEVSASVAAPGADVVLADDGETLVLRWALTIPARDSVAVGWSAQISDTGGAVTAAEGAGLDVPAIVTETVDAVAQRGLTDRRLSPWLEQALADLNSLRMATVTSPEEPFFAAGSPWFLTLFGRDSIWTARLLLPVDLDHAASTLRTLAALQGTKTDEVTAEEPGKIIHELRRGESAYADMTLPPLYYGTIDATPLWISLLHDAWRAGLPDDQVTPLLPHLTAALSWMADHGDADGDGFLEYLDRSGRGLSNQGWKDSNDSVRFTTGEIADGPVALCEVQGYAYAAAVAGAELLDAFHIDGGERWRSWAADLAARFRASFWCERDGERFPALALDGAKQRVDSVTSNIGHLLGTGILNDEESAIVARRVTAGDLDSGLGLRTMSDRDAGYSPLSYHCGSVWPHDTAIVIDGLVRAGHIDLTDGLVEGLLRSSVVFEQRLPELWSGEGPAGVPYPTACRPQAWSAAAAVTVTRALLAR